MHWSWNWQEEHLPQYPSDYPSYILYGPTGERVLIPAMAGNPKATQRLRDRIVAALNYRCNCHAESGNHLDSCPESFNYRDA